MKNLIKISKRGFFILLLSTCFQKTSLTAMSTLQERCIASIAQNLDLDDLMMGLILGDRDTFNFIEDICLTDEDGRRFAKTLLPDFMVLKRVLRGHVGCVRSLSWSPDGTSVASGASDNTVRTWNLITGEQKVFAGHQACVTSVAWSPDGASVASGSYDRTVRVVDVETGDQSILRGHGWGVFSVDWEGGPSGKCLMSWSYDKTVRAWDLKSGGQGAVTNHKIFAESKGVVLACNRDHTMVAVSMQDGSIKVWRMVVDLDQALLILFLYYLKKQNMLDSFYVLIYLEHLRFFLDAWFRFDSIEQDYLRNKFKFKDI